MTERRVNRGRRKEDHIVQDKFLKLRRVFVAFLITAFLVSAMSAIHFYWSYKRSLSVIEDISNQYIMDMNKKSCGGLPLN